MCFDSLFQESVYWFEEKGFDVVSFFIVAQSIKFTLPPQKHAFAVISLKSIVRRSPFGKFLELLIKTHQLFK